MATGSTTVTVSTPGAAASATTLVTVTTAAASGSTAIGFTTVTVSTPAAGTAVGSTAVTVTTPNDLGGWWRFRDGAWRPVEWFRFTGGVWKSIGGAAASTAMPTENLPGWTYIYGEEFDTPFPVGSFPVVPSGGLDGYIQTTAPSYGRYGSKIKFSHDGQVDTYGGAQYYPSKTVSTRTDVANANGVLDAYLHTETIGGVPTALGVWMRALRPDAATTQIYGRVSIRARADLMPGWGAVQLFIATVWPSGGEQDWPEGDLSQAVHGFFHNANADGSQVPVTVTPTAYWQDWHVYTIEWTAGRARWYIDNTLVLDRTLQVGSTAAKYIPLQAGGAAGDGTPPSPSVSGHIQIDWLAMWDPA